MRILNSSYVLSLLRHRHNVSHLLMTMPSPLLDLPEDLWLQLSVHLPPSAIFTLLQTSPHIHTRLRPLLPALSRNLPITQDHIRHAILQALRTDHQLAFFLLHLAPPFTSTYHPLHSAFRDTHLADSLPSPFVQRLVAHFLVSSNVSLLYQALHHTASIPVLLTVTSLPLASCTVQRLLITRLIHSKAIRGESTAARTLLLAHPDAAAVPITRPSCVSCTSRHTLLHVAAETGDTTLTGTVLELLHHDHIGLLNMRDCAGETALSVAIRQRRFLVAQQLVRGGAEVRELVGCAARGGGALDAADVWFKPVVDVD